MTDIKKLNELEGRIIELENREGFHEHAMEQLNQTIIQQHKELMAMKHGYQQLIERVSRLKSSDISYSIDEEKPPHY